MILTFLKDSCNETLLWVNGIEWTFWHLLTSCFSKPLWRLFGTLKVHFWEYIMYNEVKVVWTRFMAHLRSVRDSEAPVIIHFFCTEKSILPCLLLCSIIKRKSYEFGMLRGWNDRNVIFEWTVPLRSHFPSSSDRSAWMKSISCLLLKDVKRPQHCIISFVYY